MYDKYNWRFDETVVKEFDKHVRQSVPLYELFHKSLLSISKYFIRRNTEILDIGTSTGFFIKSLHDENLGRDNQFIGIDIESSMISECSSRYKDLPLEFLVKDCFDVDYSKASIISMVLFLQFLEKHDRVDLLKKIYNEIEENTALLIVEKVKTSAHDIHDIYNDLYYDFKQEQGLTDTDILNKNKSLRGVMKPLLLEESIKILTDIGFKVDINIKYHNFVSIIAVK